MKSIKILLCNCLTKFARVRNYACGDIKAKINGVNSGKDCYKKKINKFGDEKRREVSRN